MSEPTEIKKPKPLTEILSSIWDFFYNLLDLKDGLDKEGTIISIKSNKEMKGANAWLLMCSILIASLGLDLNSPAVIIGGMLISPLMSPILGIGLGIGINDRNTLNISGKHLLIAIGIALVTSTVYFAITASLGIGGGFTDEIRGRTSPSILDAMVALIGGLAGIISSSRKDQSNAIPGVAIATALMPPLCVTGYGIAQFFGYLSFVSVMFNSFFLFVLNATLVALATYFIVRFMQFPSRSFESAKEEFRSKSLLYFTSLALLSISIFTTYNIISDNNKIEAIETFIRQELSDSRVVTQSITKNFASQRFEVKIGCVRSIDEKQESDFNELLKSKYGIDDAEVIFTTPSDEEINKRDAENDEEVERVKTKMAKLGNKIDSLQNFQITQLEKIEDKKITILKTIALSNFENIEDIKCYLPIDQNDPPAVAIQWKKQPAPINLEAEEQKIKTLVLTLMEFDTLILTSY
jgi:uncharacterized hydrophobic protein (TIGR00271 family)